MASRVSLAMHHKERQLRDSREEIFFPLPVANFPDELKLCANWMLTPGCMPWARPRPTPAAQALTAWLMAAPAQAGPLFRRMYKGNRVATTPLSADQVARIVQRRAKLAGLDGD